MFVFFFEFQYFRLQHVIYKVPNVCVVPIDDIWIFFYFHCSSWRKFYCCESLSKVQRFCMSVLQNGFYVIIFSIKPSIENFSFDTVIFQTYLINFIFFFVFSQDLLQHVMIFLIPNFSKSQIFYDFRKHTLKGTIS